MYKGGPLKTVILECFHFEKGTNEEVLRELPGNFEGWKIVVMNLKVRPVSTVVFQSSRWRRQISG